MIFTRKYVFETRKTRAIRMSLNALVLVLLVVALYGTFLLYTVFTSRSEAQRFSEGLYQKAPDAIVVFTGDKGRIRRALELTKRWPEAKMLISGVHGANNLRTIVGGHQDAEALLSSPQQVDIGYNALDTLGNVHETLQHLDQSAEKIQRVLVVTSDYHVLRVRMIFRHEIGDRNFQVFYDSVPSSWGEWTNIKKLLLESLKTLRVWFILKLG